MAQSQKSLLLPATRSQCKSPGDGGVPAQPLPADPPASPPGTTSSRQTARTQPQHPPVKEREGQEDFTPLPKGFILCQGWGGARSPPRLTRRMGVSCGGPGDVGGFPWPSDLRHSGASLLPPARPGGWGLGGLIPLLLSPSPGRPHLFWLFGSFAGSAVPAHPKGAGCSGSSWGERRQRFET